MGFKTKCAVVFKLVNPPRCPQFILSLGDLYIYKAQGLELFGLHIHLNA